MAKPTGGPPVARGDAFIVPKAPRTKRRGNPNTERTRDMDKVRKLKAEADRDAAEAEKLHNVYWADTTAGVGPCIMVHHEDPATAVITYVVRRTDTELNQTYSDKIEYTAETLNGLVKAHGTDVMSTMILEAIKAADHRIIARINTARRHQGLPQVRWSMQRWQDPLVLRDPPLSQATKKGGNVPVTQEMAKDSGFDKTLSTLIAMNRGYISKDEARKRLQNITDA